MPDVRLEGRRIALGVTGGIAAFKAVTVARELMERGAALRVAMTPSAARFVTPLTFAALTAEEPFVDLWRADGSEPHITLSSWAEAFVIAPATATSLARFASGLGEDAVSATWLAFRGPRIVAPAMHARMWEHPATRRNIEQLRSDGVRIVGPEVGRLASGETAIGRMSEPPSIVDAVEASLGPRDLVGTTILITAGPTHEALDPVRFLGNRSSGKMGFALAGEAQRRGAHVVLILGPVQGPAPAGAEVIRVTTALEMQAAVHQHAHRADAIIMAAAVADFRPREVSAQKLKKSDGSDDAPALALVRNPDILAGLGTQRASARPVLIGFAVESERVVEYARSKLERKRVDLIVANPAHVAFEGDDNEAWLISHEATRAMGRLAKRDLARAILDWLHAHLEKQG